MKYYVTVKKMERELSGPTWKDHHSDLLNKASSEEHESLIQLMSKNCVWWGTVAHACNPSYTGGVSRPAPGKNAKLNLKKN
jgi:hypothetical protein